VRNSLTGAPSNQGINEGEMAETDPREVPRKTGSTPASSYAWRFHVAYGLQTGLRD
jgi:hypothetical protein